MGQEIIAKAAKIVEENAAKDGKYQGGISTVSLIDEAGFPTASVISPSKFDGINWITFGTNINYNNVKRIRSNNRAAVSFSTAEYCVNLVGEMEIITSSDIKREMWYDGLAHHFTDADDPNYCVLKFSTKRYKLFIDGEEVAGTL